MSNGLSGFWADVADWFDPSHVIHDMTYEEINFGLLPSQTEFGKQHKYETYQAWYAKTGIDATPFMGRIYGIRDGLYGVEAALARMPVQGSIPQFIISARASMDEMYKDFIARVVYNVGTDSNPVKSRLTEFQALVPRAQTLADAVVAQSRSQEEILRAMGDIEGADMLVEYIRAYQNRKPAWVWVLIGLGGAAALGTIGYFVFRKRSQQ